jgi:hypothetical protein
MPIIVLKGHSSDEFMRRLYTAKNAETAFLCYFLSQKEAKKAVKIIA